MRGMKEMTPTQALATALLCEDVYDWLTARRNATPKWSFALLASELADATNGQVQVSGEAIRQWLTVEATT